MKVMKLAMSIVNGSEDFNSRSASEKLELLRLIGNCHHCGVYHFLDTSGTVLTDSQDPDMYYEEGDLIENSSQVWCEDCVTNSAFAWSDGELHNSPPVPGEEDPGRGIPRYHSLKILINRSRLHRPDVLGIELETYQANVNQAAEFFKKIRQKTKKGFKYERDGSLDGNYGVEVAAQPYSLQEIKDGSAPWKEVLDWSLSNDGRGWDAGDGYGMHISLNGNAIHPLHRARIVRFINDNKSLCCSIAGREESSYARYGKMRSLTEEFKRAEKYFAAAIRPPRIEVRIFRSTLNWNRFLSNCEFVDAVRVYTSESGFDNKMLSGEPFKDWMLRPENLAYYENLAITMGITKKRIEIPGKTDFKERFVKPVMACAD